MSPTTAASSRATRATTPSEALGGLLVRLIHRKASLRVFRLRQVRVRPGPRFHRPLPSAAPTWMGDTEVASSEDHAHHEPGAVGLAAKLLVIVGGDVERGLKRGVSIEDVGELRVPCFQAGRGDDVERVGELALD